MPYQPTFPQPYLKSIDVEEINEFSVVINPRDIINKYNLTIYSEDDVTYNTNYKDMSDEEVLEELESLNCDVDFEYRKKRYSNLRPYIYSNTDDIFSEDSLNVDTPVTIVLNSVVWVTADASEALDGMKIRILTQEELKEVAVAIFKNTGKHFSFWEHELKKFYGEDSIKRANDFVKNLNFLLKRYISEEGKQYTYTTEDIMLEEPLYGSLIEPTGLSVLIPTATTMEEESGEKPKFINGSNYMWQLTLYDETDFVTTPLFYFTTRKTPETALNIIDETGNILSENGIITSCSCGFKGSFSQEQGEKYSSYIFNLYTNGKLVASSGDKMESKIVYEYDRLMSNTTYTVELIFTMADRKETVPVRRDFNVEYKTLSTPIAPHLNVNEEDGFIEIDFSETIQIIGESNKETQYISFKNIDTDNIYTTAQISKNQYISYSEITNVGELDIPNGFTLYLHENFCDNFNGKIIELTDENSGQKYTVGYNGRCFYYKIPGMPEVTFDPYIYVDENGEKVDLCCVQSESTTINDLNYDAFYMLYPDSLITPNSIILYNDIAKNFWWHITLLPDKVEFTRGEKYEESVVS